MLFDEVMVADAESVRLRAAGSICMVGDGGSRRRDGLREAVKADNQSFMKGRPFQNTEYDRCCAGDDGSAQKSMDPERGGLQGWKKLDVVDGRRSEIILGFVHNLSSLPASNKFIQ